MESTALTDREFLVRLEARVDRETRGFPDARFHRLTWDGIVADAVLASGGFEWLVGKAYFLSDDRSLIGHFRFRLKIGPEGTDTSSVQVDGLIPRDHVTGWLGIDFVRMEMEICPELAVPVEG